MQRLISRVLLLISISVSMIASAQQGWWQARIHREDGKDIVFMFEWKKEAGKPIWYIHNAAEKIKVTDITISGDSIFVRMPLFESQFRLAWRPQHLQGAWIKGSSNQPQVIAFSAEPGQQRFTPGKTAGKNISGRWRTIFNDNGTPDSAVAEFKQSGNHISGTFLTNTGDDRYLEGIVRNDSVMLSCFDGVHAFLFTAKIENERHLAGGWYYSGAKFKQEWEGMKDSHATVAFDASAMHLKPGEDHLDFTFNDLDGKPVSINDARFRNKVVVIQIMGSWCPNCMDETAYLSDYYDKNKQRGVEIIALAYEYSTDLDRSRKSLEKFRQHFHVQYPMLITGVTVGDPHRTEKTLPQLTDIKTFPSSIILDKKGKVRKLDNSFNGPATGEHYLEYKRDFEKTVDDLLKEN